MDALDFLLDVLGASLETDEHGGSGRIRNCDPCVPNPVIGPHRAEKSGVLVSSDRKYLRSFLT